MTKDFESRLLACGSLDTNQYRYVVRVRRDHLSQCREIWRLPISFLSMADASSFWQYVKSV